MGKKTVVMPVLLFLFSAAVSANADTFSFKAERMSGTKALGREMTILSGNAEVKSDNLLLKANRIEIHGDNNQFIDCSGGVWGMEEEKNIIFHTDRLRYDRKLKIARLEGNSTLEDRENEVVAKGNFIEYDDESEVTVFQISVRLFKDDMVGRSEYAGYVGVIRYYPARLRDSNAPYGVKPAVIRRAYDLDMAYAAGRRDGRFAFIGVALSGFRVGLAPPVFLSMGP